MTGNKPTVNVVREFRGTRLYLVRVTRAPKGYRWTADKAKALKFDVDKARALCAEASRDYGALCAAIDIDGTVLTAPESIAARASRYTQGLPQLARTTDYKINSTRDPNAEPRVPKRVQS